MSNGSGWVIMDVMMILVCSIAAVLQIAVFMDRSIGETRMIESGRLVLFTGYTVLSARFMFLLTTHGDILIPPVTEVGIALIAIGHICFSLSRLRSS